MQPVVSRTIILFSVHWVPEVVDLLLLLCNLALNLSSYLLKLHLKSQRLRLLMLQTPLVGGEFVGTIV